MLITIALCAIALWVGWMAGSARSRERIARAEQAQAVAEARVSDLARMENAFAATAQLASAQSAPHGPEGFRNNYPHEARASFWAWQWERLRNGVPTPPPGGWKLSIRYAAKMP